MKHCLRILVLLALLGPPLSAQERPALVPDASQAVIDGRVAIGVWPMRDGEILGPVGFTVHLASDEVLEDEHVYPAGTWFQPPPGTYKTWVEGVDESGRPWVEPSFSLLHYAGSPFRGRGLAGQVEVEPAGRVVVDPVVNLEGPRSVRLLHVTVPREGHPLSRGFLRAITPDRVQDPVLVPRGQVVALLYDSREGRYLAASPPVSVGAGSATPVRPHARRGVADLLAILERPKVAAAPDGMELFVTTRSGDRRPPDVVVPTTQWIYALWYDLDGRSATLAAQSENAFLDPVEVVLQPGGVETFRGSLRSRPHLDVRLELPPELKPERAVLELTSKADRATLAEQEISLDPEAVTRIEGLPSVALSASLSLEGDVLWKLSEPIDLSDGLPQEHVFRPDPFVLSGTVYYRDEPTPARLRLATLNERDMDRTRIWVETDAGEDGRYELVLFAPGCYRPRVELPDFPGQTFGGLYRTCVDKDTNLDIHVPDASVRIVVHDALTGEPVEGAALVVQNEMETEHRSGSATSHHRTDAEGVAFVPLLYPGWLKVWAEKDGYLRTPEPVQAATRDGSSTAMSIDLDPILETRTLHLVLPSGRPAAGAEVRAQYSAWNEPPAWQGTADPTGRLQIPERVQGGWLLVRHPDAGAWIQGWAPQGDEVSWTLPPASGPVTFRTVGLDGRPVPWSTLALRFPHAWVAGRALAWLTGNAIAGGNAQGLWRATGLPAADLAVIAGSHRTLTLALQGLIDGSAARLSPPWPTEPVEVLTEVGE